jgi:hypothetical protein
MSYMSIWSPSDAEKDNILNQHNKPYDGYATLRQSQTNQTPLMVQDFAKDKKGMTVGNNGKVQGFTNVGINEGLYGQNLDVQQDLDPKAGFDYVQGSSNDEDTFEGMHKNLYKKSMEEDYDEMDPAYDFDTDGPEEFETKSDFDSLNQEYQTQQDELDYESQHDTDPEAREMISRMQKMMNKEYDGQEKMNGEQDSYNFMSGGPDSGESYSDTADGEFDEEYDEEMLDENFKQQKTQILEMFNRISRF